MARKHFNKLLVSIFGFILTFTYVSFLPSMNTMSNAFAQEKTSTIGADKIKAMLLRPNGWIVEWRGNTSGVIDFIFEERGENIVVKIYNAAWNVNCERDVTITSDVIKLDGCSEKKYFTDFRPQQSRVSI